MSRLALLLAGLLLLAPPLKAQGSRHGVGPVPAPYTEPAPKLAAHELARGATARRTLLFALGGAVLGVVVCTAISNVSDDHDGFSTCTARGYLLLGGGGAVAGAVVALITSGDR